MAIANEYKTFYFSEISQAIVSKTFLRVSFSFEIQPDTSLRVTLDILLLPCYLVSPTNLLGIFRKRLLGFCIFRNTYSSIPYNKPYIVSLGIPTLREYPLYFFFTIHVGRILLVDNLSVFQIFS